MKNITISFESKEKLLEAMKLAKGASKLGAGLALGDTPPLNILKSSNGAIVQAQVPGVNPSCLNIRADKNLVEITGIHNRPDFKTPGYYIHEESTVGKLHRLVELPFEIDCKKIEVKFWNGILTIEVPRVF